jgi:hypothetical protein
MDAGAFLRMRLRYDPYSPTAVEDYEKLAAEVERFDILGMLSRELTKSRIHDALVRRLLAALQFLSEGVRDATVATLLDNLSTLTPVLPTVLIVLRRLFLKLGTPLQDKIVEVLAGALEDRQTAFGLETNVSFALRVLGEKETGRAHKVCLELFDRTPSPMIRRDVVLLMAKWKRRHWLSALKAKYRILTPWEKRAFVIASYALGAEGAAWRGAHKAEFDVTERLLVTWAEKAEPGTTGFGLAYAQ